MTEVISLLLLTVLVEAGGLSKVPAQAIAVAAATPLSFLGNKLWSFRRTRLSATRCGPAPRRPAEGRIGRTYTLTSAPFGGSSCRRW